MIVNGETAMVPEFKELWLRCFSDSAEDVDYFFEHRFQEEESLAVVEDGKVAGMVFLLPAELAEIGRKAVYIYAFATHPDFRGCGIATHLLEEIRKQNQEKGILTFLCPAEDSLVGFYEKRGFYPSFFGSFCSGSLPTSGMRGCSKNLLLTECSPAEYAAVRSRYLKAGDIVWDARAVQYAVGENAHSGGECRRILLPDGRCGAALLGIHEDCLIFREVLLPDSETERLPELAALLAEEFRQKKGSRLSHWRAVMPERNRGRMAEEPVPMQNARKQLIGMSDEQGIFGYLNLVLD